MKIFEWMIEDIVDAHPDLYLEHCAVMAVALMSRKFSIPYEFKVTCKGLNLPAGLEEGFILRVSWSEVTATKARRIWQTEQRKAIAERAAVALAALLFAKLIPNAKMRVTSLGDHADYWLPQLRCALEVSGTESPGELPRRHREKIVQVLSNPLQWNAYVVVSCFDAPHGYIEWSYHKQE
jgi:hypothetical protein